jgi:hypothetical protein
MVDYYALISPTIEPLANATPDERKVVYDRLVTMLDQQLRAADPPRSDKDILKERINLEAAIRRLERRLTGNKKPEMAGLSKPPLSVGRSDTPAVQMPIPVARKLPIAKERLLPSEPGTPPFKPDEKIEPTPDPLPPERDLAPAPEPTLPLAAAPAPLEISIKAEAPPENTAPSSEPEPVEEVAPLESIPHEQGVSEPLRPFEHERSERPIYNIPSYESVIEPGPAEIIAFAPPLEMAVVDIADVAEAEPEKPVDLRPSVPSAQTARRFGARLTQQAQGLWLRIGILALVILALASVIGGVAEYLAQRSAENTISRNQSPSPDTATTQNKIIDRLPVATDLPAPNGTPASGIQTAKGTLQSTDGSDPDILIQRAILLEEPPGGLGDPKRTVGRVSWKLETIRSTLANTSDIGARATIDLTDAGLSASFVFRRNRDQSSANTHLIEITMTPTADNPNGKVRDISVPELRVDEKTRGTNLAGIAVPVADNVFLIGLNGLPVDMQRNIDLLRNRSWFLVPLRYSNGKRALLLFEKGKLGERVFEDAMQTWQ